jgi:N-acetylglucosaminyl-diphospho-decaprenol L-rhamnosyltransferase
MKLYISVVNHHHDNLIISNNVLKNLALEHTVILKSNTSPSQELVEYCNKGNIHLLKKEKVLGFGANNNDVFHCAWSQLGMNDSDYFLVLNPDVIVENKQLEKLLKLAEQFNSDISAINLYKNCDKTLYDNSIRHYHSFLSPVKSLLGMERNDIYDKSEIHEPITIDWAAGSFLLFKAECYKKSNGFDERYFMYFEDADICTRANKQGLTVMYFPQIEAIHLAAHNNRKLFSKHLQWYITSLLRYHMTKFSFYF